MLYITNDHPPFSHFLFRPTDFFQHDQINNLIVVIEHKNLSWNGYKNEIYFRMDDFFDLKEFVDIYTLLYEKEHPLDFIHGGRIRDRYYDNEELMAGYEIPLDILPVGI